MKYKFIGKPDKIFPFLKTGNIYDCEIKKYGLSTLIHGVKIQMIKPICCPYSSINSFRSNWEKV